MKDHFEILRYLSWNHCHENKMTINAAEVVGKENPFFVIGTYANANGDS